MTDASTPRPTPPTTATARRRPRRSLDRLPSERVGRRGSWSQRARQCAELHADLLALQRRDARPADPEPAARLHADAGRRRIASGHAAGGGSSPRIGSSRDAFSRPLAVGLTTLGLAGAPRRPTRAVLRRSAVPRRSATGGAPVNQYGDGTSRRRTRSPRAAATGHAIGGQATRRLGAPPTAAAAAPDPSAADRRGAAGRAGRRGRTRPRERRVAGHRHVGRRRAPRRSSSRRPTRPPGSRRPPTAPAPLRRRLGADAARRHRPPASPALGLLAACAGAARTRLGDGLTDAAPVTGASCRQPSPLHLRPCRWNA